jgi:NAD(P)-dependent dehydrogenase (short-subunit alcohol dehydrogenase family)
MEIENSTALVTGSNRGIGRALVEALLSHGAKRVYATARNLSALEPLVTLDPERVVALELDVTNDAKVKSAATIANDVNLLINNAGALDFGSVLSAPPEAFKRNFDVNFYGPLHVARAFAPVLETNKGAIATVLSIVSLASMPGIGVYNASKAAAWSLMLSLRGDFAKRGVKVFSIFPGPIDTDMAREFTTPKTSAADAAKAILAGIESGREDIFPDPMSEQVYAAWQNNHKTVEAQFAAM